MDSNVEKTGSCLCGGVKYEISGELSGALNCHCTLCRKAHGAAFRSRAAVNAADFRWVKGEELVSRATTVVFVACAAPRF